MSHKHYTFRFLDSKKKEEIVTVIRGGNKDNLSSYLRAAMYYFMAQNKIKQDGDERAYCDMLAEEYAL